ncbi:hypothetical protein MAPG_08509 [Magnaporthiopsis poae ATCC 64411]|uniref:Uncharacterized protein n=1 Tax=Magnaporthiopsis poae (strain ATCC 64411 / 73-15) TaxID=644358 RepID=A0A0C4E7J6_MAGP6|nr:hypothetical protein MAPG_08509 [Magnaporthiopsis poae ATCC 64411]
MAPHVTGETPQTSAANGSKAPAASTKANRTQAATPHPILVEEEYGLVNALRDPDRYLRHLSQKMVEQRPWIAFDDIYNSLKCTCAAHSPPEPSSNEATKKGAFKAGCQTNSENVRSFGITSDFPASHRTFRDYNSVISYLVRVNPSRYKTWRELVANNGELPFPAECFTRGFFAARTALGHGTTRFTLKGGRKEKRWDLSLKKAKLGFLHHDPNTPNGKVDPFWDGFVEHQICQWQSIKTAVDGALRERRKGCPAEESEAEATAGKKRKRLSRADSNRYQDVRLGRAMKLLAGAASQEEVSTSDSDAQPVQAPSTPEDDQEMLDEEQPQGHTYTEGPNKNAAPPQQPGNDHSEPATEEEQIQAQLLRDMSITSESSHQGSKLPETPRHTSAPGPPQTYPGLSIEDAAKLERQRKIAEAVAQSHLRLKLLIAAQQANPGSYLITHDGLPRPHSHPPRANDTPTEHRQLGTPEIIWGTPRTPVLRTAQLPSTPQGRSITLVSPTRIKIEPPRIVRPVKTTTPRTARSVTASQDGCNSDVFYTPMTSTPTPNKRPRLE